MCAKPVKQKICAVFSIARAFENEVRHPLSVACLMLAGQLDFGPLEVPT